jgi:hypothetical protein
VVLDDDNHVREIQVKQENATSHWIWGAFKMPGRVFHDLHALWRARDCRDEFVGTLVNAYIAAGGSAVGVKAGKAYVDVGTLHGYRSAMTLLAGGVQDDGAPMPGDPHGGPVTMPFSIAGAVQS